MRIFRFSIFSDRGFKNPKISCFGNIGNLVVLAKLPDSIKTVCFFFQKNKNFSWIVWSTDTYHSLERKTLFWKTTFHDWIQLSWHYFFDSDSDCSEQLSTHFSMFSKTSEILIFKTCSCNLRLQENFRNQGFRHVLTLFCLLLNLILSRKLTGSLWTRKIIFEN